MLIEKDTRLNSRLPFFPKKNFFFEKREREILLAFNIDLDPGVHSFFIFGSVFCDHSG